MKSHTILSLIMLIGGLSACSTGIFDPTVERVRRGPGTITTTDAPAPPRETETGPPIKRAEEK